MAIAGSTKSSIFLQLNGRKLNEGAAMLRQGSEICESPTAAWFELHHGTGQCYMRLLGSNLLDLRELYADWLEALKLEEEGE